MEESVEVVCFLWYRIGSFPEKELMRFPVLTRSSSSDTL